MKRAPALKARTKAFSLLDQSRQALDNVESTWRLLHLANGEMSGDEQAKAIDCLMRHLESDLAVLRVRLDEELAGFRENPWPSGQ